MKRFNLLSLIALLGITTGCVHMGEGTSPKYHPVVLDEVTNHTFYSPWANQEAFGYREWPTAKKRFADVPFVFEDEEVISLAPGESINITFEEPVAATGLAVVHSANFVYGGQLAYTVSVSGDATGSSGGTYTLHAPEWLIGAGESGHHTFGNYDIFVDGHDAKGQFGFNKITFGARPVNIKEITISNQNGNMNQHLMIAAMTLIYQPVIVEVR